MNENDDAVPGIGALRTVRAPERDLWPGIEARIRRRHAAWPQALAASLVAAAALLMLVGVPGPRAAAGPALTADARAIVRANLGIVEGASRHLRQALAQDPHSASLQALLARTEHRQRALQRLLQEAPHA